MQTSNFALAALAAGALLGATPATALTIEFSGSGVVQGSPPPTSEPGLFNDLSIGPADASYSLGGETGWSIDVSFEGSLTWTIEPDGVVIIDGPWTGSMSGRFQRGGDSLSFTGSQYAPFLGAPIELAYTITGGTGAYAGYIGSGVSAVQLLGNPFGLPTPVPFIESGVLTLTPVPEPGSWALWCLGLVGMGAHLRARRPQPLSAWGVVR